MGFRKSRSCSTTHNAVISFWLQGVGTYLGKESLPLWWGGVGSQTQSWGLCAPGGVTEARMRAETIGWARTMDRLLGLESDL